MPLLDAGADGALVNNAFDHTMEAADHVEEQSSRPASGRVKNMLWRFWRNISPKHRQYHALSMHRDPASVGESVLD